MIQDALAEFKAKNPQPTSTADETLMRRHAEAMERVKLFAKNAFKDRILGVSAKEFRDTVLPRFRDEFTRFEKGELVTLLAEFTIIVVIDSLRE